METFVFKLLIQEGSMNLLSALKSITKIILIMYHLVTSDLQNQAHAFTQSDHKQKYRM